MIMLATVEIRGSERKMSKKGNEYNVVSIEQGVDTLTIMTEVELKILKESKGKTVGATFEYNPIYKGLTLTSFDYGK